MEKIEVEPAIGWQWTIWYQWDGHDIEHMIAVAVTVEKAIEEAHYSLSSGGEDYTIL
ncbi:MAG: hypothetical protein K2W91_13900 [Novosphingobium sp.]|nr:hypothetical protein [Novosphingobium sp.]